MIRRQRRSTRSASSAASDVDKRQGKKGGGRKAFTPRTGGEAGDEVAERMQQQSEKKGNETSGPNFYGGNMG